MRLKISKLFILIITSLGLLFSVQFLTGCGPKNGKRSKIDRSKARGSNKADKEKQEKAVTGGTKSDAPVKLTPPASPQKNKPTDSTSEASQKKAKQEADEAKQILEGIQKTRESLTQGNSRVDINSFKDKELKLKKVYVFVNDIQQKNEGLVYIEKQLNDSDEEVLVQVSNHFTVKNLKSLPKLSEYIPTHLKFDESNSSWESTVNPKFSLELQENNNIKSAALKINIESVESSNVKILKLLNSEQSDDGIHTNEDLKNHLLSINQKGEDKNLIFAFDLPSDSESDATVNLILVYEI